MKKLIAIVEDRKGNVTGALTSAGEITLPEEKRMPREQLRNYALALAAEYEVDPASFTLPAPTPAPLETDSVESPAGS